MAEEDVLAAIAALHARVDTLFQADVVVDTTAKTITWKQAGTQTVLLVKTYDDVGTTQSVTG